MTVRSNAEVDSVLLEGHRSVGVRLVDGTDVRAGIVILAAGTYGSPMILMRSGIGPANHLADVGIATAVDLNGVGANLADHPGIDFDSGWRGAGNSGPLLHSIGTFRSSQARPDGPPDLMFWLTDPDAVDPGFYLDPVLLKPVARGSVRLRSSRAGDPPRITLPSATQPADLERLAEGYRLAIEIANRPEIRGLSSELAPICHPTEWPGISTWPKTPTRSRTSWGPAGWGRRRRTVTSSTTSDTSTGSTGST